MRLLLDTHAFLWWLSDDPRLGQRARDIIANPRNDVLISVISLWEVTVKVRIGKLKADIVELLSSVEGEGFTPLGLRAEHLQGLIRLPLHPDHRDPFDHLLIAQAMAEQATFVSDDRNVPRYAMTFLPCSDSLDARSSP